MFSLICFSKIRKLTSFIVLRINLCALFSGFIIFLIIIWSTGLKDFLFEVDFNHFKWPPYVDVRSKVVHELLGNVSEKDYYNDWKNFSLLSVPRCNLNRFTRRKFLLIIVKTAPHRKLYREAIRSTYAQKKEEDGCRITTIFVQGIPQNKKEKQELMNESIENGDMLIGNFVDDYFNNTLKFLSSIYLANLYCGLKKVVPYLFLVDDDYLVSTKNLVAEALRHATNEHLYMGWRFEAIPFRLFFRKHRISLEEYPYSKYPPFISAGAVLLSKQTVKEFYLAIQHTALFKFDDVYAGILAYFLGIKPQHNENFAFYDVVTDNIEAERLLWKNLIAAQGFAPMQIVKKYAQLKDIDAI